MAALSGFILTYLGIGMIFGLFVLFLAYQINKDQKTEDEAREALASKYSSSMADEIMSYMRDSKTAFIITLIYWPIVVRTIIEGFKEK